MKYFGLIVLLICMSDCSDDIESSSSNNYVLASNSNYASASGSNYRNVEPLKNYGGIYSPRYYINDGYDDQSNYQGNYVQGSNNYGGGQNNYGYLGQRDQNYYGPFAQGGQNYYRQGAQLYGQAGAYIGNGRYQGNNIGIAGGSGFSAGLGLSAGLAASLAGNIGNNIGIGINGNLQLNLNAGIDISNREDIVRPCNVDDWQCMRKFFATNSQCSPAYGPVPDPLYMDQNTMYMPYNNQNLLMTNLKITGLGSAKVRDFYVNRVTGNLVFTLDFQNLNETSPRSYMKYQRRGRESIILADFTSFAFAQLSLTVVIPRLPNLRLDMAEVNADFDEDSPKYEFGPGIYNSTDSLVVSANARLTANLQTMVRESFLFQAQLLAAIYIQQNICDFGMKLSSS